MFEDYPSIDGFFNWNSWPDDDTRLSNATDLAFKEGIEANDRTGPYIMGKRYWICLYLITRTHLLLQRSPLGNLKSSEAKWIGSCLLTSSGNIDGNRLSWKLNLISLR